MKAVKLFISISLLLMETIAWESIKGQNYYMGNFTVTTCSGNFYDSGGPLGNYGSNENYTMVFYPGTAGNNLRFTFTTFELESHPQCNKDYLKIYDGINVSAPLIGKFCGSDNPGVVTATNPDGALTFEFRSDNRNNQFPGWVSVIECISNGTSANGIWTGALSTDWNDPGNWDDGLVPGLVTDVTIPSSPAGGNYPETNLGNEAICQNLTIEAGAHLYIPSNNYLTVYGTLYNLAGVSGLLIKSDAVGSGSLIHSTTGVPARVERFLDHSKWHYIGIPVSSALAGIFNLPPGHSNIYLRSYDEATNTWNPFIVPTNTPLELGRGYSVWVGTTGVLAQDETILFQGQLNSGNYTTGSNGFYPIQYTNGHGLNLISNPYPSALLADIQNWPQAPNKIAQSVWVWDPDIANYRYWNGVNGTNSSGYGTLTDGIIPANQGFLIQATGNNPWLTIPQSSRVHGSQLFYKSTTISDQIISLKVEGNGSSDAIFVRFLNQATSGFDPEYDVIKLFGNPTSPQLYTLSESSGYSINTLPLPNSYQVIPIGFESEATGNYTLISGDMIKNTYNMPVFLEDRVTGYISRLTQFTDYSFYHEAGNDPDRFWLHFGNPLGMDDPTNEVVSIYSYGRSVYITSGEDLIRSKVQVFNMLGQQVSFTENRDERTIRLEMKENAGYFLILVSSDLFIHSAKVIIQ